MTSLPLVSCVIVAPLLGALGVAAAPARWTRVAGWVGVAVQAALASALLAAFDPSIAGPQLVERRAWMPAAGVAWHVGVDGVGVLLPLVVALQTAALIGYAASPFVDRPRAHVAWTFVMAAALDGLFLSLDLVLFFTFWELTLVPMHALIAGWGGGPDRRYAAARYTLTMLAGGAPLLVGIGVLATSGAGIETDIVALAAHPAAQDVQRLAGALIVLGMAFKLPIVGAHAWMPWTLTEGPVSAGAWTVGAKLGVFGLLRLVVPLTPGVLAWAGPITGLVGLLGLLHGAFVALEQRGLRRLIAFTSLSHVGLVLLGIGSGTAEGLQGAVLQLLTFGLSAPLLVVLSGMLVERVGTTDVDALGGLGAAMPRWTALLVASALAAVGFPGTSGFVAELLLLVGAFLSHPGLAVLASCGMIVGVAAIAAWVARACGGPVARPAVAQAADLSDREVAVVLPLLAACVLIGLAPGPVLRCSETAVDAWIAGRRAAQAGGGPDDPQVVVVGPDRVGVGSGGARGE